MRLVVGVDIGGTFTDLAAVDPSTGDIVTAKAPSTTGAPEGGLLGALAAAGVEPADVAVLVHGTTVATNALLERRGAVVGLVTTAGFRDLLELRRRDRPGPRGAASALAFEPLVPRRLRLEVAERTAASGEVVRAPDEASLTGVASRLVAAGAEALVVGFLNAYANPSNERTARRLLEARFPGIPIVASVEVLPEPGEFERLSSAAAAAYLLPLVTRYVDGLVGGLSRRGFGGRLFLVQSAGTVVDPGHAAAHPLATIMSGPAAGALAAAEVAGAAGLADVVAVDMGGTSFDVAVVRGGHVPTIAGARIGFGLPIRVPMLDVESIGAGGGSVARVDDAGALQVGPESAGALPGPACYGRGGDRATVTDADLILGRTGVAVAGGLVLDRDRAARAVLRDVAGPLGLDLEAAAAAVVRVVDAKMADAVRAALLGRGLDPGAFTLVAYGGAGPLHAAAVARGAGVPRVLVPYHSEVFSAVGCLLAEVGRRFYHPVHRRLDRLDPGALPVWLAALARAARRALAEAGAEGARVALEAEMAYEGQAHPIAVPLPDDGAPDGSRLAALFAERYRAVRGPLLEGHPLRLFGLRAAASAPRPGPAARIARPRLPTHLGRPRERRLVRFADEPVETPVFDRAALPVGADLRGALLVEQPGSATLVPPGGRLTVDPMGNLVMTLEGHLSAGRDAPPASARAAS
jgi:N-methylhydantoinase A